MLLCIPAYFVFENCILPKLYSKFTIQSTHFVSGNWILQLGQLPIWNMLRTVLKVLHPRTHSYGQSWPVGHSICTPPFFTSCWLPTYFQSCQCSPSVFLYPNSAAHSEQRRNSVCPSQNQPQKAGILLLRGLGQPKGPFFQGQSPSISWFLPPSQSFLAQDLFPGPSDGEFSLSFRSSSSGQVASCSCSLRDSHSFCVFGCLVNSSLY